MPSFVALDFETANHNADSACAVGLVRVQDGEVVGRDVWLIRPPSPRFVFTYIHGITWTDVAAAPTFGELWPELKARLKGVRFIAAHNAAFDRGVLRACCRTYGIPAPSRPFVCTVQLARRTWGVFPTRLPDVCRHLGIELNHHEALSDAHACAQIVLRAQRDGWVY
jgi:DNA polymerase-3 subunit epsilon